MYIYISVSISIYLYISIYISIYLYLSIRPSVCLSISIRPSVCLIYLCISVVCMCVCIQFQFIPQHTQNNASSRYASIRFSEVIKNSLSYESCGIHNYVVYAKCIVSVFKLAVHVLTSRL